MTAPLTEIYANSVSLPHGLTGRARMMVRNLVLNARSTLFPQRSSGKFLRGLYLHYVFDDQRKEFEEHLAALRNIGEFITTDDMVAMVKGEVPVDGCYFQISFDDGLECVARNAVPILDEMNIPAIVFVNPSVVGPCAKERREAWDRATNYRMPLRVMGWQTLIDSGLEIGGHTRHHLRLAEISCNTRLLHDEIVGCKADIESATGRQCNYFAWPYGTLSDVDEASIQKIYNAGYKAAFGVYRIAIQPRKTNPMMIPRHHFEPQWPHRHVFFFARGGMEKDTLLPNWGR